MELRDIISVYENIYNQELMTRRAFDQKFSAYFSLQLLCIALMAIGSKWIFTVIKEKAQNFIDDIYAMLILALFLMVGVSLLVQIIYFYKSFFRTHKNYLEMPVQTIRNMHLSIGRKKIKLGTYGEFGLMNAEDEELLAYMKDSYIYCAEENRKTNKKRHRNFMVFENATCITTVLSLVGYFLIYMRGDLQWLIGI